MLLHLHISAYLISVNEIRSYSMIGQCGHETDWHEIIKRNPASEMGCDLFDDTVFPTNQMRLEIRYLRTNESEIPALLTFHDARSYVVTQQICKAAWSILNDEYVVASDIADSITYALTRIPL